MTYGCVRGQPAPNSAAEGVEGGLEEAQRPAPAAAARSPAYVYTLLTFWLFLSILMVFLNKYVLTHGFPFPATLAWLHMLTATGITQAVGAVKGLPPQKLDLFKMFLVIGFLFAGTLFLSMMAFLYLNVSTIQMLKLTGPAASFCVGLVAGVERFNALYVAKIAVVCCGVAIASYGDIQLSVKGMVLQLAAIGLDALRCTGLQLMLQAEGLKLGPLATLTYLAPCTAIVLLPIVALVEGPKLAGTYEQGFMGVPPMLMLSCAAAALINVVIFEFIGTTSALTANISSVLKDIVIIAIAASVQGVPISRMQVCGYSLALCGLAAYHYEKVIRSEVRAAHAAGGSKAWQPMHVGPRGGS